MCNIDRAVAGRFSFVCLTVFYCSTYHYPRSVVFFSEGCRAVGIFLKCTASLAYFIVHFFSFLFSRVIILGII